MKLNKLNEDQAVESLKYSFYGVVYNVKDSRYQNIKVLLIINNDNKN